MTLDRERVLDAMVEGAKLTKTATFARGSDFAPTLHVVYRNDRQQVATLVGWTPATREIVPAILKDLRRSNYSTERYVGVICDAVMRQVDIDGKTLDEARAMLSTLNRANPPGSISAAFEAGDLSVIELLSIVIFDVDADQIESVNVEYRIDDRGQLVFDEPRRIGDNKGRVPELLREGVKR